MNLRILALNAEKDSDFLRLGSKLFHLVTVDKKDRN